MIIYLITCIVNGKSYVGQTSKTLSIRWSQYMYDASRGSRFPIHCAIRKYGSQAFSIDEIAKHEKKEQADNAERMWIILLICLGGEGNNGPRSEETKQKISAALKGKPKPVGMAEKIRKLHSGKVLSIESKAKISASQKLRWKKIKDTRH